jgi:hypothetical protein
MWAIKINGFGSVLWRKKSSFGIGIYAKLYRLERLCESLIHGVSILFIFSSLSVHLSPKKLFNTVVRQVQGPLTTRQPSFRLSDGVKVERLMAP